MLSETGTPQIAGALAWIDCDMTQRTPSTRTDGRCPIRTSS
jgi:flavin reductase (DIM6/NTAB) family NADH-FMN oxidoreductase RutF